jgi:hypothetical protein
MLAHLVTGRYGRDNEGQFGVGAAGVTAPGWFSRLLAAVFVRRRSGK